MRHDMAETRRETLVENDAVLSKSKLDTTVITKETRTTILLIVLVGSCTHFAVYFVIICLIKLSYSIIQ